ncbi:protease Do-like 5, chloroplastic, partial [Tasmannia lanceolata]|uniref:protease Do-like 5, chloroplastic n=1 Tax=Tasmannia lanceolata TaxID=3420 RepID=UPI0040631392
CLSLFGCVSSPSTSLPPFHSPKFSTTVISKSKYTSAFHSKEISLTRRKSVFIASSLLASFLPTNLNFNPWFRIARAEDDEFQEDEERVVHIFQEASPSVVFIKDIEIVKDPRKSSNQVAISEDENEKVEGTGSGFLWDKIGHVVFLLDTDGNTIAKEGKLIGFDPAYDLAVLKVDVEGNKLKPALIGSSRDLHVGQSCFAIGNPYRYEHTLTTGVVSGLGREIPSPNGRAIRGAIQTDAAINADSYLAVNCEDAGKEICASGEKNVPASPQWTAPDQGFFKLNFEGSSFGNPGPSGIWRVLKDDKGMTRWAFSGPIVVADSNETELKAALQGIICSYASIPSRLIVEGDSLNVVRWMDDSHPIL